MVHLNTSKAKATGQKFIARNRAPRVQIEYDIEIYGNEQTVEIPFVMGVVGDLAGKSAKPSPEPEERKFMEIDTDNFDDRLKSIQPRVTLNVPNAITGQGMLAVDLTFESMDDFSPAHIARKVPALDQLLQARSQLSNLLSYMDGKSGAEELLTLALKNPALLKALAAPSRSTEAPTPDAVEGEAVSS